MDAPMDPSDAEEEKVYEVKQYLAFRVRPTSRNNKRVIMELMAEWELSQYLHEWIPLDNLDHWKSSPFARKVALLAENYGESLKDFFTTSHPSHANKCLEVYIHLNQAMVRVTPSLFTGDNAFQPLWKRANSISATKGSPRRRRLLETKFIEPIFMEDPPTSSAIQLAFKKGHFLANDAHNKMKKIEKKRKKKKRDCADVWTRKRLHMRPPLNKGEPDLSFYKRLIRQQ